MKPAITFLVLLASAFSQAAPSAQEGLRVELRTSSDRVRMSDDITLTVIFRSKKEITLWNFLAFGPNGGMHIKVFDASGHEVQNSFADFGEPIPPDLTGKDALLSIGGRTFAGFDDRIEVRSLFPKPGRYRIRCLYIPRLPRNYFRGHTIWGEEDGGVGSPRVDVVVE